MEKYQKIFKIISNPLSSFFQFLMVITPLVAVSPNSVIFWGETECPKEILEDLATKKKH